MSLVGIHNLLFISYLPYPKEATASRKGSEAVLEDTQEGNFLFLSSSLSKTSGRFSYNRCTSPGGGASLKSRA